MKMITLTGVWNPRQKSFKPGDLVDISLVGVPKGSPAPVPGQRVSDLPACIAMTISARVIEVRKMDETLLVTVEI